MQYVEVAGARIPSVGFGTFELESDVTQRIVRHALEVGYRHIDTAQMYNNEAAVGRALADSGVDRDEVFLTTKIWLESFRNGDLQRSLDESLQRLGVERVDLTLLHWPNPEVPLAETLQALLDARDSGRTRHIGVSNFPSKLMRQVSDIAGPGQIVTNQVEYHPFLNQRAVLDSARHLGIAVSAYCPLARGEVFGNAVLRRIGERHGKNPGQVALRWLLDQNVVALPRTRTEAHAEANFEVFDFTLSEAEHDQIDRDLQGHRRLIDPPFAPDWDRG
ncbi:MAG: aldo/keto reductase [Halofilum sp. (in: g-proteobacteria)]